MNERSRIDPASLAGLERNEANQPPELAAATDVVTRRAILQGIHEAEYVPNPAVSWHERSVPTPAGDVRIRIIRPNGLDVPLPGILLIHGGGMVFGTIEAEAMGAEMMAAELGAVVVSTEYRKAPEYAHPAQSEDCFASYSWLVANAEEIGVDATRIAVYGGSAGANLTLAVGLMARDRGVRPPVLLCAPYPMLDHTSSTRSAHEITDPGFWHREINIQAWGVVPRGPRTRRLRQPAAGRPRGSCAGVHRCRRRRPLPRRGPRLGRQTRRCSRAHRVPSVAGRVPRVGVGGPGGVAQQAEHGSAALGTASCAVGVGKRGCGWPFQPQP